MTAIHTINLRDPGRVMARNIPRKVVSLILDRRDRLVLNHTDKVLLHHHKVAHLGRRHKVLHLVGRRLVITISTAKPALKAAM